MKVTNRANCLSKDDTVLEVDGIEGISRLQADVVESVEILVRRTDSVVTLRMILNSKLMASKIKNVSNRNSLTCGLNKDQRLRLT